MPRRRWSCSRRSNRGCHLVLGQTGEARAALPAVRRLTRPERADLREASIRYREADCVGCLDVLRSVQRSSYRRGAADAMLQEGLLLIDAGYAEAAAGNIERFPNAMAPPAAESASVP